MYCTNSTLKSLDLPKIFPFFHFWLFKMNLRLSWIKKSLEYY